MRILLLSSLLLLGGVNLILARSIYWGGDDYNSNSWTPYDYDLFDILDKSEENSDKFDEVEQSIMDSALNAHDNDYDPEYKVFNMFFNNPFVHVGKGNAVPESSEETTVDEEEKHDEVKEEVEDTSMQVESVDLTKSSEEKKNDEDYEISDKDIEEMAALIITLNAMDGLIDFSNKKPEYDAEDDDELKTKEVDQFLDLFNSFLDNMLVDHESKENENDNDNDDDVTTPTNESEEDDTTETDSDDNDYDIDTTTEPDSDEDNNVTTPEPDSDEDKDDDDDDDVTTPKNDSDEDTNNNDDTDDNSNSNENEIESFSLTFHSIDDDNDYDHKLNLNDHKYEIVHPTTKPTFTTLNFDDNNVIQEYVELRQDLDTEQDALKVNEQNLDKDFYTIISNNYNEESVNRFEKDFYMVHENLDRIKRNVNAIQNLNSKLYLHKLVNQAVNKVSK